MSKEFVNMNAQQIEEDILSYIEQAVMHLAIEKKMEVLNHLSWRCQCDAEFCKHKIDYDAYMDKSNSL